MKHIGKERVLMPPSSAASLSSQALAAPLQPVDEQKFAHRHPSCDLL